MEWIDGIINRIQQLDQKKMYTYIGILIGSITALSVLIIVLYYRSAQSILDQIETLNADRQHIQTILTELHQVQKQKLEVHKMIEQDEDFNILAYFQLTLAKMNLDTHIVEIKNSRTEREDAYAEEDLKAQLSELTMKTLTELLQEIEKNKRLYFKELEITRSKKRAHTIEISLTIATLIKKG